VTPQPTVSDQDDALALLSSPPTAVAAGLAFTRLGPAPQQAPTVLLVHGLGASRLVWAPIVPELSRRYHTVVVDLPGHGASAPLGRPQDGRCAVMAHRLAEACEDLGIARPHVVGNSLGGWVGLELAADGAASSLVALAPAGLRRRPASPNPILKINRVLARSTGPLAVATLGLSPVRRLIFATGSSAPAAVHPDLARGMVRSMADSTGYEAVLAATRHLRFERKAQITVPTVVVFGDRDWILPGPNQRREMAPDHARWVQLPRCGHAPMWDAVPAVLDLVEETVARAEHAPGSR